MNKKQKTYGIFAIAAILVLGISSFVAAHGGFGFVKTMTENERLEIQAEQEAIQTAIENSDFTSWKSLMESRIAKMQSELTEENFNLMIEKHSQMKEFRTAIDEARESGDFSKVKALQEEYGIEIGFAKPSGMMIQKKAN